MAEVEESEFGRGFAYCLGLFLAHAERIQEYKKRDSGYDGYPSMWFNGAADHLYDLEIPENFPDKDSVVEFRDRCIGFRLDDKATWDDARWALDKAKELLLTYDRINGVPCMKGQWE